VTTLSGPAGAGIFSIPSGSGTHVYLRDLKLDAAGASAFVYDIDGTSCRFFSERVDVGSNISIMHRAGSTGLDVGAEMRDVALTGTFQKISRFGGSYYMENCAGGMFAQSADNAERPNVVAYNCSFSFDDDCRIEQAVLDRCSWTAATGGALLDIFGADSRINNPFLGSGIARNLRINSSASNTQVLAGGSDSADLALSIAAADCECIGLRIVINNAAEGILVTGARFKATSCHISKSGGGSSTIAFNLGAGATDAKIVDCTSSGLTHLVSTASTGGTFTANGGGAFTETGAADSNNISQHTGGLTIIGADSIVNGVKRKGVSSATVDAYVEQFTHTNPKGVIGIGTIKNTDVANSLTVKETVTDAFAVTDSLETVVAFGNHFQLDPTADISTARPPYVSYKVEVKSTAAGFPANFDLQHASLGQ
jgi:hypothetical protein